MPAAPADSKAYNHSVYFIIMLQGFGLLLPWNVTLNAVPYFSDLYSKDTPIATYLTSAYIYPQLPMLFLITFYGHRISFTARIVASLAVQIVLLAAMPLLAPHSMWLTLGIFFVIGLSTAVLQSSVFGFSSFFPPIFNQGLMVGQGLSGVLACIANVMVLLLLPDAKTLSAAVYFGVSAASLGACLVSYLYLLQMSFAQFYIERATKAANRDHEAAATSALDNDGALLAGDDAAAASDGHAGGDDSPPRATLRKVFPSVALMASSVFLVFVVTFVVFPGIAPFEIAFKNSLGSLSLSDKWWQLTLLTVFNVFDTAGRMAPALGQLCKGYSLFVASVLRCVFIPLFIAAANSWTPLANDIWAFIVMMLFSITNGYQASLAMMHGPSHVKPHERELAGFVMTLALQAGIFSGSQIALGLGH